MLKKTGSKKGFTLAELLIVVAIIAVLTAIAVPLFVGSINNAEENVKQANIRAVRGAAVVAILNAKPNAENTDGSALFDKDGKLKDDFYVKATVTKTGEITGLTFVTETISTDSATKNATGGYDVELKLSKTDLTGTDTKVETE